MVGLLVEVWGGRGGEDVRFRSHGAKPCPNPLLVALSLRTFFRQPKESARTNVLRKSYPSFRYVIE